MDRTGALATRQDSGAYLRSLACFRASANAGRGARLWVSPQEAGPAAGEVDSRCEQGWSAIRRLRESLPVRFAIASLEWILDSGTRRAITDEERPQNLLVAIEGINDRSEPGASMPPAVPGVRFRRTDRLVPPATKPGEPLVAVASTR